MRNRLTAVALSSSLIAIVAAGTFYPRSVRSAPADGVSLLQVLADWKYPDSKTLGGASMSDAGIPPMQAVKCAAILTTPDPIEKVVAFYAEKLKAADDRTVAVQDDSGGRPLTLRVFAVNRLDTSTTLVISRGEGEEETHIAWSHCLRIPGGR